MQALSTQSIFYLVVTLIYLEKKNVILGGRMDFAGILQSMKTEKSVKYLEFRVVLYSLRMVWQVFGTFSHLQSHTILRSSNFDDDGWYVRR